MSDLQKDSPYSRILSPIGYRNGAIARDKVGLIIVSNDTPSQATLESIACTDSMRGTTPLGRITHRGELQEVMKHAEEIGQPLFLVVDCGVKLDQSLVDVVDRCSHSSRPSCSSQFIVLVDGSIAREETDRVILCGAAGVLSANTKRAWHSEITKIINEFVFEVDRVLATSRNNSGISNLTSPRCFWATQLWSQFESQQAEICGRALTKPELEKARLLLNGFDDAPDTQRSYVLLLEAVLGLRNPTKPMNLCLYLRSNQWSPAAFVNATHSRAHYEDYVRKIGEELTQQDFRFDLSSDRFDPTSIDASDILSLLAKGTSDLPAMGPQSSFTVPMRNSETGVLDGILVAFWRESLGTHDVETMKNQCRGYLYLFEAQARRILELETLMGKLIEERGSENQLC